VNKFAVFIIVWLAKEKSIKSLRKQTLVNKCLGVWFHFFSFFTFNCNQLKAMALSTISGTSFETTEKLSQKQRFQISQRFVIISTFCFLAWIMMLISFASPYWLSSVKEAYSDFIRLGLWDVCFKNYRHPQYQYDEVFDGCHWIYSPKYQNIRDWLQPSKQPMPLCSRRFQPPTAILF